MGLRSSMILCAGGFLANFVLVPLIWMIGSHLPDAVYPAAIPIAQMTANQIFRGYVRFIGVGAIATAGIFGIIKSLRIVAGPSPSRRARSGTGKRTASSAPTATSRSCRFWPGWSSAPSAWRRFSEAWGPRWW